MKILLSFFAFLLFPTISFAAMPDFPMAFWGTATVDGTAVPIGSTIRVYDESTKVGEVVVQEAGVYGYTEPTMQKLIVGGGEGELTFRVQSASINGGVETAGISTVIHNGFVSGETVKKDLNFVLAQTSSGGGSSSSGGGGGGGGSSKKKVADASELVLGVTTTTSSTTLSVEEQKIVLQKQLIEILTLLISLLKQKMLLI